MARLLVIDTHAIQYKAPVFRRLQANHGHQVSALYASDFSTRAYHDEEFGIEFAWDQDLTSGYTAYFESQVPEADLATVACRRLLPTLLKVRPQAIVFHTYTGRFVREAMLQLAALPIPWVFRAETTDHALSRSPLRSTVRDLSLRAFYARCASLAYIGKRSRAHYERLGVAADKLFFSPYGVEVGPFQTTEADRDAMRGACRRELDIADDRITLLFSGKLSERKDPGGIIDAVRLLPSALRERVTIAYLGTGELHSALRAQAAAEPRVDIRLLGFKNQTELSRYFHAADAAVLGSLRGETWGLVMNEALHHGLPCLASDQIGSTPDLIVEGQTGFSFTAGDPASLARAIEAIAPLVGQLSVRERAREHVAGYSLDASAAGLHRAIAHALR